MNKFIAFAIASLENPETVDLMRMRVQYFNADKENHGFWGPLYLHTGRHIDEYLSMNEDPIDILNLEPAILTVGLFYRYHHHRYFKHHRPRKLRKAK